MFQQKVISLDDKIENLTQQELSKLIGHTKDSLTITDIEPGFRVRTLRDYDPSNEEVTKWQENYLDPLKHFHPGELMSSNDSNEFLNKFVDEL